MLASASKERGIEVTTLDNGVRIITEYMPYVRSVSVGVWIGTGSRREKPEENGLSHFIEHMLFKGTTNRSAEEIARSVDSIGGHLDAFTSKELVSYNAKVLDEHLTEGFDVLSDLVLNPLFRPEDVEKEKGVILEELKMEADNPEYLVHEIFCSNFWKGHSLGRSILGTKETITSFNRNVVQSHYSQVYSPANILITAAGNLKHNMLVDLAAERFSNLCANGLPPSDTRPLTHARIKLKNKRSLEQVHLCLGVPSYPMPHEMRFACYVLNTVLGAGMSSRLFQNIRERLGLVYAVFSELNLYRDSGCLMIYAGTSAESAPKVVECIMKEFHALKDDLLSTDEMRRAKDHLKGSLMLSLESSSSRMANLARQELFFGRFFSMDELAGRIEQVTPDEVQQIAREFFDPNYIALTMLGRLDEIKVDRSDLVC